jgi:glycosyltransferase 2 family protein
MPELPDHTAGDSSGTTPHRSLARRLISWLRWPLALSILGFLFTQNRDGLEQIASRQIVWSWFLIAATLRIVTLVVGIVRWWILVRAQDIPFALRDAMRLGFLGHLFNYVLPGSVGGDVTKVVLTVREKPEAKAIVAATVVLDRLIGLYSLVLVGAAASVLHPSFWSHPELRVVMLVFLGGSVAGLIGILFALHPVALNSRVMTKLQTLPGVGSIVTELCRGVALYQTRRQVLAVAVGLGLIIHLANISSLVCCTAALGMVEGPSWVTHLFIVPVAEIAAAFLPLPGGIGAREGALQVLYGLTTGSEAARQAGFFAGLSFSLLSICVALAGGVWVFVQQYRAGHAGSKAVGSNSTELPDLT